MKTTILQNNTAEYPLFLNEYEEIFLEYFRGKIHDTVDAMIDDIVEDFKRSVVNTNN